MRKFYFVLCLCFLLTGEFAKAEVTIIIHPSKKNAWTEKQIRDLYLGLLKMREIELYEQADGQPARTEFYEKFLNRNENQMKRQRSVSVFSGERVPATLTDDESVFERVKSHPNAIGYVSSSYFDSHTIKVIEALPISILKIK